MKISLVEENGKIDWDKFLAENDGSFLQGFSWGEFQESLFKKVWRFKIEKEGSILAETQIIKEKFPFLKTFFYIPYGPCFKANLFLKDRKQVLNLILKELKKIFKKGKAFFLKTEPQMSLPQNIDLSGIELFSEERRIQPKKTLLLDLSRAEEEIFKNFHQKTRYNIRLAIKKGITIKILNPKSRNYFDEFYKLVRKTAERDKFKPYPKDYYKKMLDMLNADLFLAFFENKIITANIVVYFGKTATYLHGASDYNFRSYMAPHLLQWKQILKAKENGCEKYDFWGIDAKKWPGVTRFKKGFGGQEIEYPEGKDFVFQTSYYRLYKTLRKLLLN